MVASDVPDRGRLLLDARLPARNRLSGDLSAVPFTTLVLVLVTLFAALPLYCRVARVSPNGQGSIAMLKKLFPEWGGKAVVLILLSFASTDFIITMTLSAADAAAHFVHNSYAPTGSQAGCWSPCCCWQLGRRSSSRIQGGDRDRYCLRRRLPRSPCDCDRLCLSGAAAPARRSYTLEARRVRSASECARHLWFVRTVVS